MVALMAAGSGLSAASNYYAQPLLGLFARQFSVSPATAAAVVTLAQLGYLLGLALVVPLGDRLERRRLLTVTSALTAVALFAMGLSSSIHMLLALAAVVGVSSVAGQILVPMAAQLSAPQARGRTVSTVMSGLLIGVLLARTFAGVIAEFAGWRTVYFASAALMAVFCWTCSRVLPAVRPQAGGSYGALLLSIGRLFVDEAVLRRRALIGALCFGGFATFWTAAAFMLHDLHHLGEGAIGLFGLIGLLGALCARFSGRVADAGWARLSTGGFVGLIVVSWPLLYAGRYSLWAFAAGIVLLDLGVQGAHISNQSEIYRLDPAARSRLTTGYMCSYFLGGAVGSTLSGTAYATGGWTAVCVAGAGFGLLALLAWGLTELRLPVMRMRHSGAGR
jgi:predicted MFS family arabinose efflux permease